MWPEARSVIALGMSYAPAADPLAVEGDPERARISVYAQGRKLVEARAAIAPDVLREAETLKELL